MPPVAAGGMNMAGNGASDVIYNVLRNWACAGIYHASKLKKAMNPKKFGGSIWLLLFGAASVLLIGAFARFDSGGQPDDSAANAPTPPIIAREETSGPDLSATVPAGGARTMPSDLSAGLAEIIKMAQAHIPEDTILAYIQNSGETYNPSADEILYLTDLGVSDRVIKALLNRPQALLADNPVPAAPPADIPAPETPAAPAMPPVPAMPPAPESMIDLPTAAPAEAPPVLQNPQESYFYNGLAPYGDWVQTPDGWGWQPMVASVDAGWMPYCDRGQWVLTDDGWYWRSDYSWGWAVFHYGRWRHDGGVGWVWIPGNAWAPAWVAWRNTTDGFAGWAALPPGVLLRPGVGLVTVKGLGGFKAGYGLSAAAFTFVPHRHFLARNPGQFAAARPRAADIFRSSVPVNNYSFSGGRILNLGVSAGQIAAATGTTVPKMALKEVSSPEAAGGKSTERNLAVFRPNLDAPATKAIAEKTTQPVFINHTPRPFATDAAIPRAASIRPAPPAPHPAATSRTGFNSSSFDPARSPAAPAMAAPAMPSTGWQALRSAGDARRITAPGSPAPEVGYPSYSQRGISPPPPVPGSAQFNPSTPHHTPGYSAPSYEGTPQNSMGHSAPAAEPPHSALAAAPPHSPPSPPPAPAENHSGGAQSSQGSGTTGSSANPSKTSK